MIGGNPTSRHQHINAHSAARLRRNFLLPLMSDHPNIHTENEKVLKRYIYSQNPHHIIIVIHPSKNTTHEAKDEKVETLH